MWSCLKSLAVSIENNIQVYIPSYISKTYDVIITNRDDVFMLLCHASIILYSAKVFLVSVSSNTIKYNIIKQINESCMGHVFFFDILDI